MNNQWHAFLSAHHVQLAPESNRKLLYKSGITDLCHLRVILCRGQKIQEFLQGQLTCDLRHVNDQQASLGASCDQKGRMLSNFVIWQPKNQQDEFLLTLEHSVAELTLAHLNKYAPLSRCHCDLAEDTDRVILGIIGCEATEILEKEIALPKHVNDIEEIGDNEIIVRLHDNEEIPRYFCYVKTETAISLWKVMEKHNLMSNLNSWHYAAILAKQATLCKNNSLRFTPAMISLDQYGGVSFDKGCYLGQEIIARTQFRGKLKRHLQRLSLKTSELPKSGDELTQNKQAIGIVVNAAWSTHHDQVEILAVIQDRAYESAHTTYWQDRPIDLSANKN